MQLGKKLSLTIAMLACVGMGIPMSFAETPAKKSYTEVEFLRAFSGKSRKVVSERLGEPVKREQSVKPSNAAGVIGKSVDTSKMDASKPVNVEMWYYKDIVNYEPKKAYKMTELTFVNDRCMNIAFFNNK